METGSKALDVIVKEIDEAVELTATQTDSVKQITTMFKSIGNDAEQLKKR